MRVSEILKQKGSKVFTIGVDAVMSDVVQALMRHNCGSLVVCGKDREMVGIITERDVLKTCAEVGRPLNEIPVVSRMTRDVVTASPDQLLSDVMGLMTERRIRHLPITQDSRTLIGVISIGDAVKAQHHQLTAENHHLLNYIQG